MCKAVFFAKIGYLRNGKSGNGNGELGMENLKNRESLKAGIFQLGNL